MARSGGSTVFRCAEDGCRETALYNYSSREHYARLHHAQTERPFRCSRHADPEQVISPANRTRRITLVAERSRRHPNLTQLFWRDGSKTDVGSGFIFGQGFKAHADDFPEGSRIVITITTELPEEGV